MRKRVTIAGTFNGDTVLGSSYSPDTVASIVMQLTALSSWDGTVTVKRRFVKIVDPTVGGAATQPAAVAVSYRDETTGTDVTTAITGTTLNKIVSVRAELTQVILTTSGGTTGSLQVDYGGAAG
jgi:hypothetical protein